MPPRFAYWTIILEGKPTAFRAHRRDELLPTFKQLQTKHPDVVLKWFARGRLWESPEEAQSAQHRGGRTGRAKGWRPGGEHRDPRARFKIPRDVKRSRFAAGFRRDSPDRVRRSDNASGREKSGASHQSGRNRRPHEDVGRRSLPKSGREQQPLRRREKEGNASRRRRGGEGEGPEQ